MKLLEHVHLAYLPAREGGWTTVKEWKDVLSGGERQRVSCSFLHIISASSDQTLDGNGSSVLPSTNVCCARWYVPFLHHMVRVDRLQDLSLECTSAVSTDVEGLMYQHAKDLGITLITISHRSASSSFIAIVHLLTHHLDSRTDRPSPSITQGC